VRAERRRGRAKAVFDRPKDRLFLATYEEALRELLAREE
jgi:hypothetical protein